MEHNCNVAFKYNKFFKNFKKVKPYLHLRCFLWIVYIGKVCKENRQQQQYETVLALATLGDTTTQMGLFLFILLRPRWPRQVSSDCLVSLLHVTVTNIIMLTFANWNTA
jgi:hypothetical protein